MSNENVEFPYPPPLIPPPPPSSRGGRKIRSRVVVVGAIFALLPLIITLVASIFVDDAFNEGTSTLGTLPWLMFLTIPIGSVIVLIGLIIKAGNLGKRKR